MAEKMSRLARLLKPAWDTADRAAHKRDISENLHEISALCANSSGSYKARAELTILAVNQTFPFYYSLFGSDRCKNHLIASVVTAENFCLSGEATEAAVRLKHSLNSMAATKAATMTIIMFTRHISRTPLQ